MSLRAEIYLPGDFVICKGEIGEEMFFVSEGGLHVLTEENDDISQQISPGGFVGELGLIT
jgi:CRP-like cAMP-binding protein